MVRPAKHSAPTPEVTKNSRFSVSTRLLCEPKAHVVQGASCDCRCQLQLPATSCNLKLMKGPAFFGDGLCKVVHHIIARVSEKCEGPVQVIPWRRLQLDLAHEPRWGGGGGGAR